MKWPVLVAAGLLAVAVTLRAEEALPEPDVNDRLRMEDLWKESCKWTVGDQADKSEAARDALRNEPALLTYLIGKLPEIDSTLEFRGVWGVLNPLKDEALPFYRAGLNHHDGAVRKATLKMMAQSTITLTKDLVAQLVELSLDDRLYGQALEILGKRRRPEAFDTAMQRMQLKNSDQGVLVSSCVYIARCGEPRAVPALMNLLMHDNFIVREAALEALGSLGDPAREAAMKLVVDDTPGLRRQGIEILVRLRVDPTMLQPLLLDPDRVVRATAVRALRHLGMERSTLERILGKAVGEDPWVRGALATEPSPASEDK